LDVRFVPKAGIAHPIRSPARLRARRQKPAYFAHN
jgi:hypothetical protein